METNCRKLVSACVQLGKTRFSGLVPRRETAPLEGEERARAPRRGRSVGRFPYGSTRAGRKSDPGCWWPHLEGLLWTGREPLAASRSLPASVYSPGREPLAAREKRREDAFCAGWPEGRRDGVPFALPSNWVSALCPSFSSILPGPTPRTPAAFRGARGVSISARGAGARGPGVQAAAVDCLFSKDSETKKVEFTDSPESRKEAASSKLCPRQHPGANGKAGSEAQAARWAPASGPLAEAHAGPPAERALLL